MNSPSSYNGNGNYVFVSYSHKDKEIVYEDIKSLQQLGVRIWFDTGLNPGQQWDEKVREKILSPKCSAVIFYLTPNSVLSKNVLEELKICFKNDKDIRKEFFSVNLENKTAFEISILATNISINNGFTPNEEDITFLIDTFKKRIHVGRSHNLENKEHIEHIYKNLLNYNVVEKETSIFDYEFKIVNEEAHLIRYLGNETHIVIPNMYNDYPVTKIDKGSFKKNNKVKKIDFNEALKHIEDYVFSELNKLETITLNENLLSIGDFAFENCKELEFPDLPYSLESIGNFAFSSIKDATEIYIPHQVKFIGFQAFPVFKELMITNRNLTIKLDSRFYDNNRVFREKSKIHIQFEDIGLIDIERSQFLHFNEFDYFENQFPNDPDFYWVLNSKNHSIFTKRFDNLSNILIKLDIPKSIKYTNGFLSWDFVENATKYEIFDNDEIIGIAYENSFKFETFDTHTIFIVASNQKRNQNVLRSDRSLPLIIGYANKDDLIIKDKKLIKYSGSNNHVILPPGIESICKEAFIDMEIHSIELPNGLLYIEEYAFSNLRIQSITIPGSVKVIESNIINNIPTLEKIILKEGVEVINSNIANLTGIKEIKIPSSVHTIQPFIQGFSHFYLLNQNEFIKITIDEKNSHFKINKEGVFSLDESILYFASNKSKYIIPTKVKKINGGAFAYSKVEKVVLNDIVEEIGIGSFYFCTELQKINLDFVKKIDDNAFSYCEKLEEINGFNLEYIGYKTFSNLGYIKNINLGYIKELPDCVFEETNFDELLLPDSIITISEDAFFLSSSIKNVVIPKLIDEKSGFIEAIKTEHGFTFEAIESDHFFTVNTETYTHNNNELISSFSMNDVIDIIPTCKKIHKYSLVHAKFKVLNITGNKIYIEDEFSHSFLITLKFSCDELPNYIGVTAPPSFTFEQVLESFEREGKKIPLKFLVPDRQYFEYKNLIKNSHDGYENLIETYVTVSEE